MLFPRDAIQKGPPVVSQVRMLVVNAERVDDPPSCLAARILLFQLSKTTPRVIQQPNMPGGAGAVIGWVDCLGGLLPAGVPLGSVSGA